MTKPPNILKIKSVVDELERVEDFLNGYFKYYHLPKDHYNKVLLCVSEAVINSINHGNRNDSNKIVTLNLQCDNKTLMVQISDEGKGFKMDSIPDPTDDNNLLKDSGRGIYIIKSISDFVVYNEKTNTLQFKIECK